MKEATLTFRVDDALKKQFVAVAESIDRPAAQLLRDFMRSFVDERRQEAGHADWFRREVQSGIDAANAGDVLSAEEVEAEAAAWRKKTRRQLLRASTRP